MKLCQTNKHGNEIIHLAEMLNTENTAYKETCAQELKAHGLQINDYAHDCGCRIQKRFEGKFCKKVFLDAYHAQKHKCGMKGYAKKGYNSLAAEQLWSRLDHLSSILNKMNRRHYRIFLRHWCIWRNEYARAERRKDTRPFVSRRRVVKQQRGLRV